jgi:hypothetical protein
MRVRSLLLAASAAAMLLVPASASFAQRGGRPQFGTIKSVDAAGKTFVVTVRRQQQEADVTVKTDGQTSYMKGLDNGAFTDLKAGAFAVFMGEGTPDTGITAREVFVLEKPGGATLGEVKSADATTKTITVTTGRAGGEQRDLAVKVTDKTKYLTGRQPAKWEDITAGKRVIVIGEGDPRQGPLTALYVRIVMAPGGGQ